MPKIGQYLTDAQVVAGLEVIIAEFDADVNCHI
jgi:hypothetical protein